MKLKSCSQKLTNIHTKLHKGVLMYSEIVKKGNMKIGHNTQKPLCSVGPDMLRTTYNNIQQPQRTFSICPTPLCILTRAPCTAPSTLPATRPPLFHRPAAPTIPPLLDDAALMPPRFMLSAFTTHGASDDDSPRRGFEAVPPFQLPLFILEVPVPQEVAKLVCPFPSPNLISILTEKEDGRTRCMRPLSVMFDGRQATGFE